MGKNKKSYAIVLPMLAVLFSIIFGTLSVLIINHQMSMIIDKQEKYLGDTLSLQLAKITKNSIINKDILSLQIELDDMLRIDGIGFVAVYDASMQILSKAERVTQINNRNILGNKYINPITIENEIAGYAVIQFYEGFFSSYFKGKNKVIVLLFIGIFSTLIYISVKLGKNLSVRLNNINEQLPNNSEGTMDELSILENRLKPLISSRTNSQAFGMEERYEESTILAVECKNLTILKTRVNPEHLESLMYQFDILINKVSDIYGATRFNADQRCIYLKFKKKSTADDYPLRALCCSSVIHSLGDKLLDTHGIQLELASALINVRCKNFKSQLLRESARGDYLTLLQSMLEQAVGGEILLDEKTKNHKALERAHLSPPSEKSLLFRVEKLDDACKKLTNQQIEILASDI